MRDAIAGADTVVHLAGALLPRRGETLYKANLEVTQAIVEGAVSTSVKNFVYLSFPGADPASRNQYLRSKGMAEEVLHWAGFSGAIFRVPMILGPQSPSWVKLRQMAVAPLVPLVGGGLVRMQPISQADVVAAIGWAITVAPKPIRVLNLVGPETLSYADLLRKIAQRLGRRPRVIPVPKGVVWLSARVAELCIPALGWNTSVFDTLFNEHLADSREAIACLGINMTPLNKTLDQALSSET